MSRSKRHGHGPRVSNWRLSEADDKAKAARKLRHKTKTALKKNIDPPQKMREVSDVWGFKKD